MRSGYKITLSVLTIMILMTLTVGTSYSYYAVASNKESQNNLATSCFDIKFEDTNSINLENSYPMSEEEAISDGTNGRVKPYTFTITNTCTTNNINYVVTLNTITGKDDLEDYIDYKIVEAKAFADGNYFKLNQAQLYNDIPSTYTNNISKTFELTRGVLDTGVNKTKTYNLYMWIDENACLNDECTNLIVGKTFEAKVLVDVYI